jgi:uncharacterized protein
VSAKLSDVLSLFDNGIVACSGGIDSLLLAIVACRLDVTRFLVAHAVSPAVSKEGTARVRDIATQERWRLLVVRSGEFGDPLYLQNPVNRCYYCKSHLYAALRVIAEDLPSYNSATLLSGANLDDLNEYRPGLEAARQYGVRHPFIEAGMDKQQIRAMARDLGLSFSELPASPCLASRLYTGTAVIPARLSAVELGENLIRTRTGIDIVRCRIRENEMLVEVKLGDQIKIDSELLVELCSEVSSVFPELTSVCLDANPYKSGRAFVI